LATIPTLYDFTALDNPTAAKLDSIKALGDFLLTLRPLAQLRQQATQNLTTGVWTPIIFGASSEDLDRDGGHSTASNTSRYTGLTPGWYKFSGGVEIAGDTGGHRFAAFGKNGTFPGTLTTGRGFQGAPPAGAGTSAAAAGPVLFQLNGTTDYVELFGMQNSGGTVATSLALGGSWMLVEFVGTA
jgi:hypothetical protein